jgi:uncharacterized protein
MKYCVVILFFFHTSFAQRTIIWEISDTTTHKKSFLVGTYHHIGNSFVDSLPVLKNALLASELAVFESVDDPHIVKQILEQREKQNQIKKLLSRKDFKKLETVSSNWKLDIDLLKPIELLVALRREFQISKCKTIKPSDTWDHFDNYLIDLAKKNNIALVGLETDSIQLQILNEIQESWTDKEIGQEISYWLARLTTEESEYEECVPTHQYQRMEIDYEFHLECEDDILNKKRNEEWMNKLTEIISTKNSFIAVGLLHLKYTCGLLVSFRNKGFLVKPVLMNDSTE